MKNSISSDNVKLICMEDIEVEDIRWLWKPYIPLGKITILQGDPGLGKTFLATQLAAIVSNGKSFPYDKNDRKAKAGNVIFQTAEDGLGDTIRARLDSASANCERIFVIDEGEKGLTLDDSRLRDAIRKKRPKLVVIDPIQAFLGADKDMHRANQTRPVMSKLNKIATEFGCAIVLIGHQNKAQGGKAIYRGLGSIDFAGAARSILVVCEMPEIENRRAIVHIKSNMEAQGLIILFDLDPIRGFLWVGVSELTADEVLNYRRATERRAPVRNECEDFLKKLLSNGPISAKEVQRATEAKGFPRITVNRAKENLQIKSIKNEGKGGEWIWRL